MKRFNDVKGFTLVELIVVIAIIAILASVSVVGFQTYIDRGRFSNDTQVAASMTTILQGEMITLGEDEFDAGMVRDIINQYNGEAFDFTPTAKNTGYFYIEEDSRIIAAKYDDISENTPLKTRQTVLLSDDQQLNGEASFNSPEEIFGDGIHMLTTSGSPIAYVVNYLSNELGEMANLANSYAALLDYASQSSTWYAGLVGQGLAQSETVDELLAFYHPNQTLYVSNSSWNTTSGSAGAIHNVLFTGGISNIPEYNLALTGNLLTNIQSLELPRTIKTIQENAFPNAYFNELTDIVLPQNVRIASNSMSSTLMDSVGISETTIELIDLSDSISTTNHDGNYKFALSELQSVLRNNGATMTGFVISYNANSTGETKVTVYTKEHGEYGYALITPIRYTITLVSNFETEVGTGFIKNTVLKEDNIFFILETYDNTLASYESFFPDSDTSMNPVQSGSMFTGWNTTPDGLGDTFTMTTEISSDITLYATWE